MWSRNSGTWLLGLVALVLVAAPIGLWLASAAPAGGDGFQAATGGVGLGPAASSEWSFFGFDPRGAGCCENELQPLPGLPCPNPGHGTKVADLPPLGSAGS